MVGLDSDPHGKKYEISLPMDSVMDPRKDILLAYEMNDSTLPPDHGYPVRVLAPGMTGSRNVKWIGKLLIRKTESESNWQKNDYKTVYDPSQWATADSIYETPVIAHITSPKDGEKINMSINNDVLIKGYAYSGGGRNISKVLISDDGCQTFKHQANIIDDRQERNRAWAWVRWEAEIDIPKNKKPGDTLEICMNALDKDQN